MELFTGVAALIQLGLKPGPTETIESGGQVHITKVQQVFEFREVHDVFEFSD